MTHNEITSAVIESAIHIHRTLGPGLLESMYENVLTYELRKRGLAVRTQVPIPVVWEDVKLEVGFRADLMVEEMVVVEIKSVEALAPVHKKQVLTYLRLTNRRVGLLINFCVDVLKEGIVRLVNNYEE